MQQMFGPTAAVDEDIVEEDEYEPVKKRPQDGVHQGLERGRCVGQAKRHDQEFKQALMGVERHFVDVVVEHEDLVVARLQIKLGEESRAMEFV